MTYHHTKCWPCCIIKLSKRVYVWPCCCEAHEKCGARPDVYMYKRRPIVVCMEGGHVNGDALATLSSWGISYDTVGRGELIDRALLLLALVFKALLALNIRVREICCVRGTTHPHTILYLAVHSTLVNSLFCAITGGTSVCICHTGNCDLAAWHHTSSMRLSVSALDFFRSVLWRRFVSVMQRWLAG